MAANGRTNTPRHPFSSEGGGRPPTVFNTLLLLRDIFTPCGLTGRTRVSFFLGIAPPEYTMMHIYRGIMPFVLLQLLGLAILALFPGLITSLPALFFGS